MASSCYARARHAEQRLAPDAPRVKDDEATETSPACYSTWAMSMSLLPAKPSSTSVDGRDIRDSAYILLTNNQEDVLT